MSQQNLSKAERRKQAVADAEKARAAQAAKDRRTRIITLTLLAVGVIALGLVIWFILAQGSKPALERTDGPAAATEDGGIPIGADGSAGTTNDGAVEVAVYLDFMCPICGQFESLNGPTLDELRESGEVTEVMYPVSILDRMSSGSQFSTRAAAAAYYVADQAPEQMSAFFDTMFANQPEENSSGLTDAQIAQIAEQAGVPADVAQDIERGEAMDTYGDYVTAVTETAAGDDELANENGGFGTPTIAIDGERWDGAWSTDGELEKAVDAAAGTSGESDAEEPAEGDSTE
ncbi:DsbA family protein [Paraoerskovia marina]|uniref:DsbA family protein n=1 Tax=Paraoerskovia marina TaxID=545619 RepID=UPI0005B9DC4D|nr:thioredoxin domain-containing protein [Paraoerskovia marina]